MEYEWLQTGNMALSKVIRINFDISRAASTREEEGMGVMAPPTFLLRKKKQKTVNWKMNKKHETVKRRHHSTHDGSRENHCSLIYGEKSRSSLTKCP